VIARADHRRRFRRVAGLAATAAAALAITAHPAAAEPRKALVLQPEGRTDASLRAKVNAALVKLAAAGDLQATAGELTYTEAATAVGCRPEAAGCKDEVLAMLAVDEIVITTMTPKPGGTEITVQRIARGGAVRDATMLLATGAPPDRLDGIAPLFTGRPAAAATQPTSPAAPSAPVAGPPPAPAMSSRPPSSSEPAVIPDPTTVAPPPGSVVLTAPPASSGDLPTARDRRLEIAAMAGGAGLATLGVVMWAAASGAQGDINRAPTTTRQDLLDLRDLESRADTYATLGNVLVATGAVVGGIATYFYLRDRRAGSTASARLVPTVLDHGAGLALTIGGLP
jgi:hypothetical protein